MTCAFSGRSLIELEMRLHSSSLILKIISISLQLKKVVYSKRFSTNLSCFFLSLFMQFIFIKTILRISPQKRKKKSRERKIFKLIVSHLSLSLLIETWFSWCIKYRNFIWFPDVKILLKQTVSTDI